MSVLKNKTVLITGGTGSFGNKFTEIVLNKHQPAKVIIYSRDEYKQFKMNKIFPSNKFPIRYFIGDVRDKNRLFRALEGVDYVIHAAALKQVPALEYNPMEAVKTNILGAENIVDASIDSGVKKVIAISSDKAVNPVNLYGATKLVAEKIFIDANAYAGGRVKFSAVRYGNVVGSRGSVIPFFLSLKRQKNKVFPITDEKMTRFWITLQQGVELVIKVLEESEGGEIFVPKIPSMKIADLAKAIDLTCKFKIVGIRPGEKIHETLISENEARQVRIFGNAYIILPQFFDSKKLRAKYSQYSFVPNDFVYTSDKNSHFLTAEELQDLIREMEL